MESKIDFKYLNNFQITFLINKNINLPVNDGFWFFLIIKYDFFI